MNSRIVLAADLPRPVPISEVMTFDAVTNTIDLHPPGSTYTKDNPYWIDSDRVNCDHKILHWLAHLGEKNWWDGKWNRAFITLCREKCHQSP